MNPTREKLIQAVIEYSRYRPEVRFGQMVIALAAIVRKPTDSSVYDIEDEELLDAANQILETYAARERSVA